MAIEGRARCACSLLLFTLGVGVLVTGVLLAASPKGKAVLVLGGCPKHELKQLHKWLAFAAAGTAVVHVYLNSKALLACMGLRRKE